MENNTDAFPNLFHMTKEQFTDQRDRDSLKFKLCQNNKVWLIVIPYKVATSEEAIETYLRVKILPRF